MVVQPSFVTETLKTGFVVMRLKYDLICKFVSLSAVGRHGDLVVERRIPERKVGGSILTQVAMLCP